MPSETPAPAVPAARAPIMQGLRTIRREWLDARGVPAIGRRLYGRGVAFVHVPKCAGRSVERGLRRSYRLSRGHVHAGASFEHAARLLGREIADQDDRHAVLEAASRQRASVYAYHLALGLRCVTGHAPVDAEVLRVHGDTHAFVTVLRDPVARFISHFRYSYGAAGQGRIDMELDAFLGTERARTFGRMFRKYFAHGLPADASDEAAERAVRACLERFDVIGFVDDMPRFESDVRAVLGRRVSFGHVNATAKRAAPPKESDIDAGLRERIELICAPDIAIHRWARERRG